MLVGKKISFMILELPNLSDPLLYALSLAYSSYAANLLNDNSGLSDSSKRFNPPQGNNALSSEQLVLYLDFKHKAIETYYKLKIQNPAFESLMGNINLVYSNEIVNSYLTLSYFQNAEVARNELRPKLYDPFILSVAKNYLADCDSNALLFTRGDIDLYPLLYIQEIEGFRKDVTVVNIDLLNSPRYIVNFLKQEDESKNFPFCIDPDINLKDTKKIIYILKRDTIHAFDLKECISHVESDNIQMKLKSKLGYLDYFPGGELKLDINKEGILINNKSYESGKDSIVPEMRWNIGKDRKSISFNEFILLKLISCNDFVRPVYFTNTTPTSCFLGLEKYFQMEGIDYRLFPIENKDSDHEIGKLNSKLVFKKIMQDDVFDMQGASSSYYFSTIHRNYVYNYRNQFISSYI